MADLASYPWWLLTLAAIGGISIVSVILTLFSNLGEEPGNATVSDPCPVGSQEFMVALSGTVNAPIMEGGTARLLNNGIHYFPPILAALSQARRSVNFMMYIWEPGEMSDSLFEVLTAKAREGVPVRVMVDGLGAHKAPEEKIEAFRAAGGVWAAFHPPRFGKLTRFHKRNHRRAIIVDGRIGFTGGMAVADKWLGNARDREHWRDSMVEVRGCIATNLQSAFTQLWSQVTGEMLAGPAYYPLEHPDDEGRKGDEVSRHLPVVSSPSNESHPLRRVFWFSVQSAREKIYITNPYFVPDESMRKALVDRARAGVDVRVLVPGEAIDIALIRWASHGHFDQLLSAGIRIWEYQPTMIHQKLMVIDGKWSIVGSANLDVRSKELNQEDVLGILDAGFAREVERTFFDDVEKAREIDLAEWTGRPAWHRVRERLALLFEEQF